MPHILIAFSLAAASAGVGAKPAQANTLPPADLNAFYDQACLAYAVLAPDGRVIPELSRNPDATVMGASTVKLLTAVMALENIDNLNQTVPLQSGSKKPVYVTIRHLLEGMLIKSNNFYADTLMDLLTRTTGQPFSELAAGVAQRIGMSGTRVVEGSGMSNALERQGGRGNWRETFNALQTNPSQFTQTNLTTPHDMARLGAYATRIPFIRDTLQKKEFQYPGQPKPTPVIQIPTRTMPDTSVKTGSTIPSGTTAAGGTQGPNGQIFGVAAAHCQPRDAITLKTDPWLGKLQFSPRDGFFTRLYQRIKSLTGTFTVSTRSVDNLPQIGHSQGSSTPSMALE